MTVARHLAISAWMDWMVSQNGLESNTQLAILSNVCFMWRKCLSESLVCHAFTLQSKKQQQHPPLLLLPSILQYIIHEYKNKNNNTDNGIQENVEEKNTNHHHHHAESNVAETTFCACWFHPGGIQTMNLCNIDLTFSSSCSSSSASSSSSSLPCHGGNKYGDFLPDTMRNHSTAVSAACFEWQGYRHATEILAPFGYDPSFVHHVMNETRQRLIATNNQSDNDDFITPKQDENEEEGKHQYLTTCAVRGATYARPENYCMCWDSMNKNASNDSDNGGNRNRNAGTTRRRRRRRNQQQEHERLHLPRVLYQTPFNRQREQTQLDPFKSDNNNNNSSEDKRALQFLNVSGQHAVRLTTPPFACGPLVLPLVLCWVGIATEDGCFFSGLDLPCEVGHLYPPSTNNLMHQQQEQDEKNNPSSSQNRVRYPEVDDMSPFCVALQYPIADNENEQTTTTPHDNNTTPQEPPLKLQFSRRGSTAFSFDPDSSWQQNQQQQQQQAPLNYHDNCDSDSSNDSDEVSKDNEFQHAVATSTTMARGGGTCLYCRANRRRCRRQGGDWTNNRHATMLSQQSIVRGQCGPGEWHCYTVLLQSSDNENMLNSTVLRIDGSPEETTTTTTTTVMPSFDSILRSHMDHNGQTNSRQSSSFNGPILDGLTIGSDHCFDMSLCFGDGSDGQGQGAIAELVVFQGALDMTDVLQLEHHLMARHGIRPPAPTTTTTGEWDNVNSSSSKLHQNGLQRQQQHIWKRQARALLESSPASRTKIEWEEEEEAFRVPLEIVAQDPLVAWKRLNQVTGNEIVVQRIGARHNTFSSDEW